MEISGIKDLVHGILVFALVGLIVCALASILIFARVFRSDFDQTD